MQSLLSPVLLAIHMILAVALIGIVLLQRSEGGLGGLGGGGGMSGFMTTRGSANLLSRTTRWLGGAFMVTSLALAWLATEPRGGGSVVTTPPAPVEAPAVPTQDQGSGAATGAPTTDGTTGIAPAAAPPPAAPAVPTTQ